jgi:phosphonopyruvate decarboxylase
MLEPSFFYNELTRRGTDFFAGVPDSLLKNLCAYITGNAEPDKHITAVNEGAAVALAGGWHLATGKIPCVYMQNSGLGNAANPLLSFADGDVYRIPLVLLVGWRGEPGVHDEPQHKKQGKVTRELLDVMGIPNVVLAKENGAAQKQIDECYAWIEKQGTAFAFVIQKDTFAPYKAQAEGETDFELTREGAIEKIMLARKDGIFVSTTGMASRELYELREKYGMGHGHDFLTVGSMGHASQIALGIVAGTAGGAKPEVPIVILDGDGAVLMHTGSLAALGAAIGTAASGATTRSAAAIGVKKARNITHIVLNNYAHDSVGGQPTIAPFIDFCAIARACGYKNIFQARNDSELEAALGAKKDGLTFIEVIVRKGARADLGRPKQSPEENKKAFMKTLEDFRA